MLMVGNVLGLLRLDEKPLLSETATVLPAVTGTARNHELGEKCHSVTALGCAMGGNIPLVFPVYLQLI